MSDNAATRDDGSNTPMIASAWLGLRESERKTRWQPFSSRLLGFSLSPLSPRCDSVQK